MVSFENDYIAGAHPKILERLLATNLEAQPGYGSDAYTEGAAERIREATGCPDAAVYFLAGGTQTNQVVISTLLSSYEGVLAASTGHVSLHEAGAIEYAGHKVLALPETEGKLSAADVRAYLQRFYEDGNHEHMVFPGMVYLSWPTEYGTLYSKAELTELAEVCRAYQIPLYVDGARLAYGLASPEADLTLPELAALADVFYIGGTKAGALMGEALVYPRGNAPRQLLTQIKQRGALLAKGRLPGIQFETLFTGDLYGDIGRHGIRMAQEMNRIFEAHAIPYYLKSPTNQQFLILGNAYLEKLKGKVAFSYWEAFDASHTVVRFATSWSTTEEDLRELERALTEADSET